MIALTSPPRYPATWPISWWDAVKVGEDIPSCEFSHTPLLYYIIYTLIMWNNTNTPKRKVLKQKVNLKIEVYCIDIYFLYRTLLLLGEEFIFPGRDSSVQGQRLGLRKFEFLQRACKKSWPLKRYFFLHNILVQNHLSVLWKKRFYAILCICNIYSRIPRIIFL